MNSRSVLPLLGATLAILAVSCANEGSTADPAAPLNEQVCNQSDLGDAYRQQTAGDFTPENLAGLAPDADEREAALEANGLTGGHFAYWKHIVPRPPFAPPLEVVCQAMVFKSPEEAAQFVAELEASPDDLASTAITWLPDGDRSASEEPLNNTELPAGARGFRIDASDSNLDVTLFAVVVPAGRYVRSVYVGDMEENKATLEGAVDIQTRIQERLQ